MPRLATAALWLLFTAVAVLSGLGAVAIVQGAVTATEPEPLSAQQVAEQLHTGASTPGPRPGTSPSSHPGPTRSATPHVTPSNGPPSTGPTTTTPPTSNPSSGPTPTRTGGTASAQPVVRSLGSRGGTVVAACSQRSVYLRSWSPAAGYVVDEFERGPAMEAKIRFASIGSSENEVRMTITCVRGVPSAQVEGGGESDPSS